MEETAAAAPEASVAASSGAHTGFNSRLYQMSPWRPRLRYGSALRAARQNTQASGKCSDC